MSWHAAILSVRRKLLIDMAITQKSISEMSKGKSSVIYVNKKSNKEKPQLPALKSQSVYTSKGFKEVLLFGVNRLKNTQALS